MFSCHQGFLGLEILEISGKNSLFAVVLYITAAIDAVLLATGRVTNAFFFALKARHKEKILAFRYGHVFNTNMPTTRRPVVVAVDEVGLGRFFRNGRLRVGRSGAVRSSRLRSDTAQKHHWEKKAKGR